MKRIIITSWRNFMKYRSEFWVIAMRMVIVGIILFIPSYYITTISVTADNFGMISLFSILVSIGSLVVSFYTIRWTVAMIYLHKYIIDKEEVSVKRALNAARQSVWRYIGGNIIIGLIATVPAIIISTIAIQNGIDGISRTIVISLSMLIVMIIINGWIGFLPYIKVFRPEIDSAFTKARRMTEGQYWKASAVLNFSLVFSVMTIGMNMVAGQFFSGLVYLLSEEVITIIIQLMITPLTVGVATIGFLEFDRSRELQAEIP